jgi:catechol 2,3-dioxygenase-like lactoylglutathione lyase family enzyme
VRRAKRAVGIGREGLARPAAACHFAFVPRIWFPPGKGDPKWQRAAGILPAGKTGFAGKDAGNALFLGIDHTAIVVNDTDKSLAFYRDALGMKVAGGAENYGVEQEHLNQVFGARLRITALKAERGPGIELLEYITPPGGRPLPADANANDLVFWHTRLVAEGLDDFGGKLREQQTKVVSARAVTLSRGEVGSGPSHFAECDSGRRSVIMRDSDGHVLQFVENSPATAVSAR